MARVILNIEAESASDLQDTINDLARGVPLGQQYVPPPRPEDADKEVPGPAPQAEEKPKRKRRTKVEIEADKKAHDAKQAESQPQNTEPAADNSGDPGADVTNTDAPLPTRQDVDAAMRALLEANGGEQMLGILRELGAINDAGHPKISALDEAKYAEAIQKAQAAVATLKEQADQAGSVLA